MSIYAVTKFLLILFSKEKTNQKPAFFHRFRLEKVILKGLYLHQFYILRLKRRNILFSFILTKQVSKLTKIIRVTSKPEKL